MNGLFKEFASTSEADWLEKIKLDLKGKSLDELKSKPEPDMEIRAYHHADSTANIPDDSAIRNLNKTSNQWVIRQEFSDQFDSNSHLLKALNEGVTGLGLTISKPSTFETFINNVAFEHIISDIKFQTLELALKTSVPAQSILNFDSIAINAANGNANIHLSDYLAFYKNFPNHKSIWVSGDLYGESGASTIQELGFTIAHLNEYIQYLTDQSYSLSEINDKIVISLSVNDNYFVNIAKFRAIHALVYHVFEGYDPYYKVKNVTVYAKTNLRHYTKNDKNNNPLRQTTQSMAAVVGGCDALTVAYPNFGTANEIDRFKRIAKNIQLILKEESYFDIVADPSGGAYYIDTITKEIVDNAWLNFLEIEKNGGHIKSIESNDVQHKIQSNKKQLIADMNGNQRTFLGVNKHANSMENWINPKAPEIEDSSPFIVFKPFYLEDYFTKTV